jgi:hypothetical protein
MAMLDVADIHSGPMAKLFDRGDWRLSSALPTITSLLFASPSKFSAHQWTDTGNHDPRLLAFGF